MTKPLTYLSLKCVLKYLEANKRIHICNRSPFLRKLERNTLGSSESTHLDHLNLGYTEITLNNITYELVSRINGTVGNRNIMRCAPYAVNPDGQHDRSADNILFPGDIPMDFFHVLENSTLPVNDDRRMVSPENISIHLYFRKCSEDCFWDNHHQIPGNLKFHVAMKRLTNFLLGSRSHIFVKRLEIIDELGKLRVLRLPLNLRLMVQELEGSSAHLEYLIPFHDCKSLKKLKIHLCEWNDPCFELPIVKSVQKLEIRRLLGYERTQFHQWNRTLLKLPNREISFNCTGLSEREIRGFIHGLLDERRQIGTCYKIDCSLSGNFFSVLEEFGERFGRKMVKENKKKNDGIPSYSISLPMSETTELFIHTNDLIQRTYIRMDVVPIPITISVEENSSVQFKNVLGLIFLLMALLFGLMTYMYS